MLGYDLVEPLPYNPEAILNLTKTKVLCRTLVHIPLQVDYS